MKLLSATLAAGLVFLPGCVNVQRPLTTQIVTFPEGGIVEVDGKLMGKEPTNIVLPQNEKGQLTGKTEIRVYPPHGELHGAMKVISPENNPNYTNRVPGRIMLDISAIPDSTNKVNLLEYKRKQRQVARAARAAEPRSKPTRPVGEYNSGAMTKDPIRLD